jgi:AraC-like DNA-binding protein
MDTWFHDNRRAFITNARRRGVDESTVMKMSGHTTRSAFVRYNIVNEEDLRRAVEKFQAGQIEELSQETGN